MLGMFAGPMEFTELFLDLIGQYLSGANQLHGELVYQQLRVQGCVQVPVVLLAV